jgi:SAM-dependent MidA family methyltransferase
MPHAESGLPAPGAEAATHGARVAAHLRSLIEASPQKLVVDGQERGSIAFADFMRAALYAPGLGYYTAGAAKLGIGGDFVTAPELSPFFGAALADAFAPLGAISVLELGAGTGRLAQDFLRASPAAVSYSILEVSADLRHRQQTLLHNHNVSWLDALPEHISGLVIANEVLDAVPCEVVRFRDGRYEQARVVVAGARFDWAWQPLLGGALLDAAKHRIPPIEGYTSEINPEAEALVATLAARLTDGALCFIDYGFPRREYYLHDRSDGTLACHYQHRVHFDPLILAGLQDITAHVDFTGVAESAVDAGASVICYAPQAQFLLNAGLLQRLHAQPFLSEAERISATGAVQKLLSPAEMGELFKVLIVGRGAAAEQLAAFAGVDQSFRL